MKIPIRRLKWQKYSFISTTNYTNLALFDEISKSGDSGGSGDIFL
jgi:hypothetical protein